METTRKDDKQIGKEGVSKLKEDIQSLKNQLQGSQRKIDVPSKMISTQKIQLQRKEEEEDDNGLRNEVEKVKETLDNQIKEVKVMFLKEELQMTSKIA